MKEHKPNWLRLDNAAKIYPAAKRRTWTNLFRLSATLTEPVDTAVLQSALEQTIPRFPSIAVRVRRGMFWYYLEKIKSAPKVEEDIAYPLRHTPFRALRKCAFRVLYFENRIAVEYFHAITDGNGGLVFLKTLLAEYLTQKYALSIPSGDGVLDRHDEPTEGELEDSFLKHEGRVAASRAAPTTYRISGTPETDGFLHLTTGILQVPEVLRMAKSYGVTLTELLTAAMVAAIVEMQNKAVPNPKRQRPVKVLVPVNLRRLFESTSLRNFVLFITPGVDPRMGNYTFEEIVKSVHYQMGMELSDKVMKTRITTNVKVEKSIFLKILPLFIKNIAMKAVYNMVGESKSCLAFSNLGAVKLPAVMERYIQRIDFILGAQATRPNNCGLLSYQDKLYINLTRNIREPVLERAFFSYLVKLGLGVKIESNQR
ncbi:MAG: hypothetical protein WDA00_04640 [Eubacteriales bacterium]